MSKVKKIVEETILKHPELNNALSISVSKNPDIAIFYVDSKLFLDFADKYCCWLKWETYFIDKFISIRTKIYEIDGVKVFLEFMFERKIIESYKPKRNKKEV